MISTLADIPKKQKFGFYRVGDLEFISKIEAIQHDNKTRAGVKWIFHDEIFSSYDWTQEPQENLEELYRQRALDIRASYDYVVIWYSGGADSHNVLSSFINNGIHVDEIAVSTYSQADDNKPSYWTQEVDATALPDINKLAQYLPHTKIRYIDFTSYLGEIYKGDTRWDWIYQQNTNFSPNNFLRSWIRELDPHYRSLIDADRKMVFVWGSDKPRLAFDGNRYGMYFQDIFDNVVSTRTQLLDRPNEHDELFYWSPSAVSMLIKQAHCLLRFLTTVPLPTPDLVAEYHVRSGQHKDLGTCVRDGVRYYLTREGHSSIIYPWWPRSRWQQPKPISTVIAPRDSWFFNTNHNDTIVAARSAYFNALEKIPSLVGEHWLNSAITHLPRHYWFDTNLVSQYRISSGLVGCKSPVYWIQNQVD
jgi:hypothetical protein